MSSAPRPEAAKRREHATFTTNIMGFTVRDAFHIVPGMSVSLEVCTNKSDDWTLMDSKDDKNMIFLNIDPAP